MSRYFIIPGLLLMVCSSAVGAERSSSHYSFSTEAIEPGGAQSSSRYAATISCTAFPDQAASPKYSAFRGFVFRSLAFLSGTGVFYNNSVWDKNDPTITAADSLAIAPDKHAMRPGGTATFANISTWQRGINGIVIDVDQLGAPAAIGDLGFTVGNDNQPAAWLPAPAPTAIVTLWGAGPEGSDRIFITWPDGAIQNKWLRTVLRANDHTQLQADAIFYYGSAVGNRLNDPLASPLAIAGLILQNATNNANIDNPYDLNRDGIVAAADARAALDSLCATEVLQLIDLRPDAPPPPQSPDLSGFCNKPAFLWVERTGDRVRFWFSSSVPVQMESTSTLLPNNWQSFTPDQIQQVGTGIGWISIPAGDKNVFVRIRQ